MKSCPPCNSNCRQSRDCPARQACELPIDDDKRPTVNLFALLVFLTAVLTIAFLGAFLIGVGYAVWPVLASLWI